MQAASEAAMKFTTDGGLVISQSMPRSQFRALSVFRAWTAETALWETRPRGSPVPQLTAFDVA